MTVGVPGLWAGISETMLVERNVRIVCMMAKSQTGADVSDILQHIISV